MELEKQIVEAQDNAMTELEKDQKIIEQQARIQSLVGALNQMRKAFGNLASVVVEVGKEVGKIYTTATNIEDEVADLKKRFRFTKQHPIASPPLESAKDNERTNQPDLA